MKTSNTVTAIDCSTRREDGPPRRVYQNVADLVADPNNPTPMVRLSSRFNSHAGWDMFVKLERNNPFGLPRWAPANRTILLFGKFSIPR